MKKRVLQVIVAAILVVLLIAPAAISQVATEVGTVPGEEDRQPIEKPKIDGFVPPLGQRTVRNDPPAPAAEPSTVVNVNQTVNVINNGCPGKPAYRGGGHRNAPASHAKRINKAHKQGRQNSVNKSKSTKKPVGGANKNSTNKKEKSGMVDPNMVGLWSLYGLLGALGIVALAVVASVARCCVSSFHERRTIAAAKKEAECDRAAIAAAAKEAMSVVKEFKPTDGKFVKVHVHQTPSDLEFTALADGRPSTTGGVTMSVSDLKDIMETKVIDVS